MIKVNQDFKKLIPALSQEEFSQLEANCLSEGIRDAIIVWNDFIIDGHNRFEIAQKHSLKYRVNARDFKDDNEVKEWMILNQFGRRNLSNYQRSVLALELEDVFRAKAKQKQRESGGAVPQKSVEPLIDTQKELAKVAKVSHDTIAKVKVIEAKAAPEVKQKLSTGEVSINQAYKEIKKEENKAKTIMAERKEVIQKEHQAIVFNIDCLEYLPKLQSQIDLLITDPPYFTDGDFTNHVLLYLNKVKSTGQAYIFASADPEEIKSYIGLKPDNLKLEQILIWNYNNGGQLQPKTRYNSNYQVCFYYRGTEAPNINKPADGKEQYACQTINAPDGRIGDRYHKWQKPNELIERLILNSSKPDDFIFDPFVGSGTTLVCAVKLGRKAQGCEIDKEAIKIANQRGIKNGI